MLTAGLPFLGKLLQVGGAISSLDRLVNASNRDRADAAQTLPH